MKEQDFLQYFSKKKDNPLIKYQTRNLFPKRLLLHVALIIICTLQVKYYGIYEQEYRSFNLSLWENLLLDIDDDEVVSTKFYTVQDFKDHLDNTVTFFQNINKETSFQVLNQDRIMYYILSYYDDLNIKEAQYGLKNPIDIQQGIRYPFNQNNPASIKKYIVSTSNFNLLFQNIQAKFPYTGLICWDVYLKYDISSDFEIIASVDTTQVDCVKSDKEFDNYQYELEKLQTRIEDMDDVQDELFTSSLFSRKQPYKKQKEEKNGRRRAMSQKYKNQNQENLSPKEKMNLLKKQQQQQNYNINQQSNIGNIFSSGGNDIDKAEYGKSQLLMINIILIIVASTMLTLNMIHMYNNVKNYIGLRLVRKNKILKALNKVKSLNKIFGSKLRQTMSGGGGNQGGGLELASLKMRMSMAQSGLSQKSEQQQQDKKDDIDQDSDQEFEYLGRIQSIKNKNPVNRKVSNLFSFWHLFTMFGNFLQIVTAISLSLSFSEDTDQSNNLKGDQFFKETLLGIGCAIAWIGISEFLETFKDVKHDVFSYLMKNLLWAWWYNFIIILPVFMAYAIIGTALYWKSEFFGSIFSSSLTLFAIYHGDQVSDFMFSVRDVTNSPLHYIYVMSYTMLFAMFIYNIFTSVIQETRDQIMAQKEEEEREQRQEKKKERMKKKLQKLEDKKRTATNTSSLLQESLVRPQQKSSGKDDDQSPLLKDDSKQKAGRQYSGGENEKYDQLQDQMEMKKISIQALINEFDSINSLIKNLAIKDSDQTEFQIHMAKYLQTLQKRIKDQIQQLKVQANKQKQKLKEQMQE